MMWDVDRLSDVGVGDGVEDGLGVVLRWSGGGLRRGE
jgi:hypothetical protein